MDISQTRIEAPSFSFAADLTSNINPQRYGLCRFILRGGDAAPPIFQVTGPAWSFLVLGGRLSIRAPHGGEGSSIVASEGEGAHLLLDSCFRLIPETTECTFLIAAPEAFRHRTVLDARAGGGFRAMPLSSYRVSKPWGWERWYTQNIAEELPYALKMIYMKKGCQSSLQSHERKSETNLVIEGSAQVLYGLAAPADPGEKIDVARLQSKIYGVGEGWSNSARELHRVIAHESYKAVEISTPELDDVLRWQDDNQRAHGRIDSEHGERER